MRGRRSRYQTVLFDIGNTIAPFTRSEYNGFMDRWYDLSRSSEKGIERSSFMASFGNVFAREMELSWDGSWETTPEFRSMALVEELGVTGSEGSELLQVLRVTHTEAFSSCLKMDPDARKVVERLRDTIGADGRPLDVGIISNAPDAKAIRDFLEREAASHLFHPVVISEELGISKPSKAIFESAMNFVGRGAGGAVYIGDRFRTDVLGARSAGMDAIYLRQYPTEGEPPEGFLVDGPVIFHIKDLLPLITVLERPG